MIFLNFEDCLKQESIKEDQNVKSQVTFSMNEAKEFISSAEKILKIKEYRLAFISGYQAMFHLGRALLFHKGYKEHSHFCLIIALAHLYTNEKKLLVHINLLEMYRRDREKAVYGGKETSNSECLSAIIDAKDFLKAVEEYFKIKM